MTLTVVPFFSTLAAKNWVDSLIERLEGTGARVTAAETLRQEAAKRRQSLPSGRTVVFVGTGGTERAIVGFLSDVRLRPPILLLSHDGNNSLPAAMETRTHLEQRGIKARIIHAPSDSLSKRLRDWCRFTSVEERLRSSRIGVIGKPSSWLVASRVNVAKVRRRWGALVEEYPLQALLGHLDDRSAPDLDLRLERFTRQAATTNVPREELLRAGTMVQALTRFVSTHKLDAVTVECFRLLQQTGISGCYAVSQLNDLPDIVAGCEGDVPAAFTMLLAKLLTGQPAFMANVTDVDLESNSAVFAHCTIPTSMVEEYEITTHFESGKSVAVQGRVKAHPVTVLKVFGEDLSRHWASGGVVVSHKGRANGCRTQVRVRLTEPVRYFLEASLANHHVIVPGNHVAMLSDFFDFVL